MPTALLEQQTDQGRAAKAAPSALDAPDSLFLRQEEELAEFPLGTAHLSGAKGNESFKQSRHSPEEPAQGGRPRVAFRLVGLDLRLAMRAAAQEVLGLDRVKDVHRHAPLIDGAEDLARDVDVVHVAREHNKKMCRRHVSTPIAGTGGEALAVRIDVMAGIRARVAGLDSALPENDEALEPEPDHAQHGELLFRARRHRGAIQGNRGTGPTGRGARWSFACARRGGLSGRSAGSLELEADFSTR